MVLGKEVLVKEIVFRIWMNYWYEFSVGISIISLLVIFFPPLPLQRNVLLLTTSDGWVWRLGHFCS